MRGMVRGRAGSVLLLPEWQRRVSAGDTAGGWPAYAGAVSAMRVVPGTFESRGLQAGGLLLLSCSDVPHSLLTVPWDPKCAADVHLCSSRCVPRRLDPGAYMGNSHSMDWVSLAGWNQKA